MTKSVFIFLSAFVALAVGNIIPEATNEIDDITEVEAAQNMNNYYANLMSMSPGNREMMGMQFPQMSEYMGYPGFPMSPMSPNMMNFPGSFPGQYQGMGRTNACGCTSTCGMPCMWWGCSPCIPCPICPEETTLAPTTPTIPTLPTVTQELTTLPPSNSCPCVRVCPPCMPWFPCNPCSCPCNPDQNTPPTTQAPTTTTVLTTVTQEITQRPPDDCVPCQPCVPCPPIWWMPCSPCQCNNGCQTTVAPLVKNPPRYSEPIKRNNCQCKCAPCPPWLADCPPCPQNCPCD